MNLDVLITKVSPTYTSQRCSKCGWTRRTNRKKKLFNCKACNHIQDADLNASSNIRLNLMPISKQERLEQKNRKGFYWNVLVEEPIVSQIQKAQ